MNLETAKKLNEAGFPDQLYITKRKLAELGVHVVGEEEYYCPTLSELIKACGKPFMALYRNDDDSGWTAFKMGDKLIDMDLCVGPSPEEAVANLWIALNKK